MSLDLGPRHFIIRIRWSNLMGILDPIVMFKGAGSFMKKVQLFIYEM